MERSLSSVRKYSKEPTENSCSHLYTFKKVLGSNLSQKAQQITKKSKALRLLHLQLHYVRSI